MPRKAKAPKIIISLSPAAAAEALDIQPRDMSRYIAEGRIPVYMCANRPRVLVSDLDALVRSWPRQTNRRKEIHHGC